MGGLGHEGFGPFIQSKRSAGFTIYYSTAMGFGGDGDSVLELECFPSTGGEVGDGAGKQATPGSGDKGGLVDFDLCQLLVEGFAFGVGGFETFFEIGAHGLGAGFDEFIDLAGGEHLLFFEGAVALAEQM